MRLRGHAGSEPDAAARPAADACAAAEAFIVRAGQPTTSLIAKVTERHQGGVAVLQVDWACKGTSDTVLRALANVKTGEAFAFVTPGTPPACSRR